jgi:integrase
MTPEQKLDAREAFLLLGDSGLTLAAAVKIALQKEDSPARKTPLQEAVDLFLRERHDHLRSKTQEFYQWHLWALCDVFKGKTMDDIKAEALSRHLESLTPSTAAARYRSVRVLWRWALRHPTPLVSKDVTASLSFRQPRLRGDVQFLDVDDTEKIMKECGKHRYALALMLFAGVRPEEIHGIHKPPLLWEHIDRAARIVRIPSNISKTKQPRILEGLPDNLWEWLDDGPKTGPVSEVAVRNVVVAAQKAAGFRDGSGDVVRSWTQDVMRHSFATYHVALYADPGKTALLLGHEGAPTMLYRHYRGLTTQAQGQAYFGIRP